MKSASVCLSHFKLIRGFTNQYWLSSFGLLEKKIVQPACSLENHFIPDLILTDQLSGRSLFSNIAAQVHKKVCTLIGIDINRSWQACTLSKCLSAYLYLSSCTYLQYIALRILTMGYYIVYEDRMGLGLYGRLPQIAVQITSKLYDVKLYKKLRATYSQCNQRHQKRPLSPALYVLQTYFRIRLAYKKKTKK